MILTESSSGPGKERSENPHIDDETIALIVELALEWTERLFPDESLGKLDDIVAGNLFITFGIDYKKTREKLAHLRQLRE